MPATYTHHLFTEEVYNGLEKKLQNKINYQVFKMFGKSFDLLNYTKSPISPSTCHSTNTNLYLKNIALYIKNNELESNNACLGYLYGSICHYVLDTLLHPYIFYKTGVYHKDDKETYKYKGKHAYLENMLDAIMYNNRTHKLIYKYDMENDWAPKIYFEDHLKNTINYTFKKTYNIDNMDKVFIKSYKNSYYVYKYLMKDKLGIKTSIYKLIDKTNIVKSITCANYSYHIKKLDYSILNVEHKKWYYPLDKTISYHYSIIDLYDIAVERAKEYITEFDKAFTTNSLDSILDKIGDLKYTTGLPCSKKGKMKYFEY